VSQIKANMERWRWLPRAFEADYLAVNIPDESLSLTLGGDEMLISRVVVGKPETPTPILRAEGGGITINPPWNVPLSIARKEILPKLKANRFYLQSQDMILLNGPEGDPYGLHVRWREISPDHFPYLIQQHPGAKNPLGTIKLELPNRFDVYLHDTPVKSAFLRPDRAVSHGCVRVERILPLASYVLTRNLETMKTIADMVSTGETQYLPLRRRLPVYFLYWTAFTAKDGALQFRPDIYGRDRRMTAALSAPSAVGANYPNCSRG
jgi:murein L,D-transpeptidase YcbB/YkuD